MIDPVTFEYLIVGAYGLTAITPVALLFFLFIDWRQGRLW